MQHQWHLFIWFHEQASTKNKRKCSDEKYSILLLATIAAGTVLFIWGWRKKSGTGYIYLLVSELEWLAYFILGIESHQINWSSSGLQLLPYDEFQSVTYNPKDLIPITSSLSSLQAIFFFPNEHLFLICRTIYSWDTPVILEMKSAIFSHKYVII